MALCCCFFVDKKAHGNSPALAWILSVKIIGMSYHDFPFSGFYLLHSSEVLTLTPFLKEIFCLFVLFFEKKRKKKKKKSHRPGWSWENQLAFLSKEHTTTLLAGNLCQELWRADERTWWVRESCRVWGSDFVYQDPNKCPLISVFVPPQI